MSTSPSIVIGRPHSREALAALFWGDMPDSNARANLRVTLCNLRQLFPDHLLAGRDTLHAVEFHAPDAGDRERYLTIIEDESVRLSKLSDNLLKLAALEALNMHFAPQSYRLDRQIRSVLLACEPQWSAKSLDVDIDSSFGRV